MSEIKRVKAINAFGVMARQLPCVVGEGEPSPDAGAVGELYMDALSGRVFKCTGAGVWVELAEMTAVSALQEEVSQLREMVEAMRKEGAYEA